MSYWWGVRRHAWRKTESNGLSIYDRNHYKDLALLPSFATYYLSMNKLIHLAGLLVFLSVNEVIRPSPIAIFYDTVEQKSQGAPSLSLPFSRQLWLPCSLGSCSSSPINLTFIFALCLESVVLRGWVLLVFIFIFIFPVTDWIQKILLRELSRNDLMWVLDCVAAAWLLNCLTPVEWGRASSIAIWCSQHFPHDYSCKDAVKLGVLRLCSEIFL